MAAAVAPVPPVRLRRGLKEWSAQVEICSSSVMAHPAMRAHTVNPGGRCAPAGVLHCVTARTRVTALRAHDQENHHDGITRRDETKRNSS